MLALIVWQRPNLLLLDEPTNHLDLDMRQALTEALIDFEGALVVVSHDRHLIRSTTDDLYLVHDGKVEQFDGDRRIISSGSATHRNRRARRLTWRKRAVTARRPAKTRNVGKRNYARSLNRA